SLLELWNSELDLHLRDRLLNLNALEQLGRFCAKSTATTSIVLHCIAQDVTDFLFHGMAVLGSAPLQLTLDHVIEVANNHLSHFHLICYHASNRWAGVQARQLRPPSRM